jgi:hypothetical protein
MLSEASKWNLGPGTVGHSSAEIWINHEEAVITTISALGRTASEIRVHAEGQGSLFFSEVVAAIGDATTVLVFGPGEAKIELGKRLRITRKTTKIHAMGSIGNTTARQIADRARDQVFA